MSTDTTSRTSTPRHPDVLVQLTGHTEDRLDWTDTVAKALEREAGASAADDFTAAAANCGSRAELLILILRTVDVI